MSDPKRLRAAESTIHAGTPGDGPPLLDVNTASRLNGALAFAGADGIRNARRCLDGVVQEITQGEETDPTRLQGDATGAYRAAREAVGEMQAVVDELEPYATLLDRGRAA